MSKKLFVGGLPWAVTDGEMNDAFAPYGAIISAKVITDKMTGRSKGFGFVEFENDADADKATAALNGSDLGGRSITVNEARPMTDRPRGPRRDY